MYIILSITLMHVLTVFLMVKIRNSSFRKEEVIIKKQNCNKMTCVVEFESICQTAQVTIEILSHGSGMLKFYS